MTTRNFVFSILWSAMVTATSANAQDSVPGPDTTPTVAASIGTKQAMRRTKGFMDDVQVLGGQLTLPFKIRPKVETQSFRLTTDVTVGAYLGLSKPLSTKKKHNLTIPFAAGLTFISLHNANTTLTRDLDEVEVVPGITWCIGAILQLEQYSIGLMIGKDYASEVGNLWRHHAQTWWSFGIGFVFAQTEVGKSREE